MRVLNFNRVWPTLTVHREAGDFSMCCAERDLPRGPGYGARAVRYPGIVENYRRTFLWLRDEWATLGLRPPPAPFPVYVFDLTETGNGLPHMFWDGRNSNWACALPSGTDKTTKCDELQFLRALAAHEGTHCYCVQQSGFFRGETYLPEPWHWISEGTAVWMELRLLDRLDRLRSNDALSFSRDWCDYPEEPMLTRGQYQCGLFMRYLAKRWGETLIARLWTEGTWEDDPWVLIRRLTGRENLLSDYADEAYFVGDPGSACYSPHIAARFHSRALAESVLLDDASAELVVPGDLRDTGTNYYAVRAYGRTHLSIAFRSDNSMCIATASAADSKLRRIGGPAVLAPDYREIPVPEGSDHLVLSITVEPETWVRPAKRNFHILVK